MFQHLTSKKNKCLQKKKKYCEFSFKSNIIFQNHPGPNSCKPYNERAEDSCLDCLHKLEKNYEDIQSKSSEKEKMLMNS